MRDTGYSLRNAGCSLLPVRWGLFAVAILILAAPVAASGPTNPPNPTTVILVVGAPGQDEFGRVFAESARLWLQACEKGHAQSIAIG
ncbi:MAG: hypothetical protein KGS61_00355, partial [Verrucomicrobia bacterium]|nr:hypothetical protein [Verrucomicrobiota bacterium]